MTCMPFANDKVLIMLHVSKLDSKALLMMMVSAKKSKQKIQIISRDPQTPAAKFILSNIDIIRAASIKVEAIFLHIKSRGKNVVKYKPKADTVVALSKIDYRLADFKEASEIIEQINFGDFAIWTGKRLKAWKSQEMRDGQISDIHGSQDSYKMASMAFKSLWVIATEQKSPVKQSNNKTVRMRYSGAFGG